MIKIKTLSKDNFASKAIKYILYSIINILAYIPMLCAFKYNQTLVHPITTRGASNISPVSHPLLAMPPWAGPHGSLALLDISDLGFWFWPQQYCIMEPPNTYLYYQYKSLYVCRVKPVLGVSSFVQDPGAYFTNILWAHNIWTQFLT